MKMLAGPFTWGNSHDNTSFSLMKSYWFYFRARKFSQEGNIVKYTKITPMQKFPRLYTGHVQ